MARHRGGEPAGPARTGRGKPSPHRGRTGGGKVRRISRKGRSWDNRVGSALLDENEFGAREQRMNDIGGRLVPTLARVAGGLLKAVDLVGWTPRRRPRSRLSA